MCNEWRRYEPGSIKRAASISALYMGLANNGGLNSFLTSSYDLDAQEVAASLFSIGALTAGKQLEQVLQGLAVPLPIMSQSERWDALELNWTDPLDQFDVLSSEADDELMAVLSRHVDENEEFYSTLA
jgi:hypothetical protein